MPIRAPSPFLRRGTPCIPRAVRVFLSASATAPVAAPAPHCDRPAGDGKVYLWDVRQRRCRHVFVDDGCIHGSALAASPDGHYLATGYGVTAAERARRLLLIFCLFVCLFLPPPVVIRSDSGVVNLYDATTLEKSSAPEPLKIVMNLTTTITDLKFNHTRLEGFRGRKATAAASVHY
jgi:hypothetical protein